MKAVRVARARHGLGLAAVGLILILACLASLAHAASETKQCEECRQIAKRFKEGLDDTAKSGFGGGNTAWEERNLGTFATSETRMVEITEKLCDYKDHDCYAVFERSEEHIEAWWKANVTAEGVKGDIFESLCVEKLKLCCAAGRYGKNCKECPGGSANPCSGHGKCAGAGTRKGNGKCSCDDGYEGKACNSCKTGFFFYGSGVTNEAACMPCDAACAGCIGPGPKNCIACATGYSNSSDGCQDINECTTENPCVVGEHCVNTPGGHTCDDCSKACSRKAGCTGAGAGACVECAEGYKSNTDGVCQDIDECLNSPCTDNLSCVNNPGAFECICASPNTMVDGVCTQPAPVKTEL